MRLVDHDVAVGFVQATVTGDKADVAWVVGTEWQGAGYAKEAVAAMTGWLVENGVTRICAHIHPNHLASQGVAISAGLARTGQIDNDGEEIWAAGGDPLI
jgi:RimJ/RimL family protein N-acetyltransferase